jgi:hypothetical protein
MITPIHASVSRSSRRASVFVILLSLLLRAAPLAAQAYTLSPAGYQTVLDNAGAIVANACVWTYRAGTTTPLATYGDALGTLNTNPIRTDPAGRFTAYLLPGVGYSFTYERPCTPPAHGVVLKTADTIVGALAAPAWTSGTWTPSVGGTATYAQQEGTYVRVGPLVFARGQLKVTLLGTGLPYAIDGLPFPVAGQTAGSVALLAGAASAVVYFGAYGELGSTRLVLEALPTAGTATGTTGLLTDGATLAVSLTYQTNAP